VNQSFGPSDASSSSLGSYSAREHWSSQAAPAGNTRCRRVENHPTLEHEIAEIQSCTGISWKVTSALSDSKLTKQLDFEFRIKLSHIGATVNGDIRGSRHLHAAPCRVFSKLRQESQFQ